MFEYQNLKTDTYARNALVMYKKCL